jgi:hypothetical protein
MGRYEKWLNDEALSDGQGDTATTPVTHVCPKR